MQRWNRAGLFRNSKESPGGQVSSGKRGMDEMRLGGGQEPDDAGPWWPRGSYSEQGGKCLEGAEQGVTWSDVCSTKQP